MPGCTIYHPDSSSPVLALLYQCCCCLAICPFVRRAQAGCLSVNVNLNVVKGYFVSRREECGQTSDIPAAYLDSRSPNRAWSSPQLNSYYLSLPVLIPVTSHILLTLCSVGLSLCLQSRFLYTFDNQIIYVIKIQTKIYIFTCKVVGFRTSLWMVCEKLWIFACWISWLVSWRNVFY